MALLSVLMEYWDWIINSMEHRSIFRSTGSLPLNLEMAVVSMAAGVDWAFVTLSNIYHSCIYQQKERGDEFRSISRRLAFIFRYLNCH